MLGRVLLSRGFQAALLAAILVLAAWSVFFAPQRFDRSRWLAAEPASTDRSAMVDDLLRRYRLIGRTQQQVIELLGPPTRTARWEGWELVYRLGPGAGWSAGIGDEWLLFDVVGERVVAHRVVPD